MQISPLSKLQPFILVAAEILDFNHLKKER